MKQLFTSILIVAAINCAIGQLKLGITDHNHIALQVKDIAVSARFYKEVLQLESIPVPDHLKAIRAWFKVGNYQIHLLDGLKHASYDDRNGRHLALFVESVDAASKYLDDKKIEYHSQAGLMASDNCILLILMVT